MSYSGIYGLLVAELSDPIAQSFNKFWIVANKESVQSPITSDLILSLEKKGEIESQVLCEFVSRRATARALLDSDEFSELYIKTVRLLYFPFMMIISAKS